MFKEEYVSDCPGCLDCGDKCDVWSGKHLWTDMYEGPDYLEKEFSRCEFCGKKLYWDV